MNKKIMLASVASGLLIGAMATFVNSPTISQSMVSQTQLLVDTHKSTHVLDLNAGITLKRSGQYEMYFLTDNKVGFNTSGRYQFDHHGLSLMPEQSEQVLPSQQNNSVVETMFSQRGMHSMEDLKVIPLSEQQLIIVAPKYSYLFTKQEL